MTPIEMDVVIPTCKTRAEVQPLVEEIIRTAGLPVRIIPTCLDGSASENRNCGLREATSSLVAMVDDDITGLPDDWLVRMIDVMAANPNCMMCSPRLMTPEGEPGTMSGWPTAGHLGCEVLKARELCTACVVIRNTGILFDEAFIGSGFEDVDYCRQSVQKFPAAEFICIHDLRVTHLNEKKNQGGEFWDYNLAYFKRKWRSR